MNTSRTEPMTKDEVMLLVQLVVARQAVILNKSADATTNRMKDQAWKTLTEDFNSSVSSSRRTRTQLRFKWDNLKKAARKRCADMKISHNQTGVGRDFFPPDEVLDKVTSLLQSTCQGFAVEFGGDTNETDSNLMDDVEYVEVPVLGDVGHSFCGGVDETPPVLKETKQNNIHKETQTPRLRPPKQDGFFRNRANHSGVMAKRKQKMEEEKYKACIFREKALAEYLIVKKRQIELENEEKEINIAKLKLELENNRLQNVKLEKVLNLIG